MKKFILYNTLLVSVFTFLTVALAQAQPEPKKLSPAVTATGTVGTANITIKYSSPQVKGRKIWGDLVPYNRVWRAGADEATTFTSDKDLVVQGAILPAGNYSLFVIPKDDEWVVIFNKRAKQWGAYEYQQEQDALRVIVCTFTSQKFEESLKYEIDNNGFSIQWANLKVPVSMVVAEPKAK